MQLKNMLRFKMAWAHPTGPDSDVVLSSRIRLARNMEDQPFPSRAGAKTCRDILEGAFRAAKRTSELKKAALISLEDIDPMDRYFLVERRLISHILASQPKNRGIAVGEEEVLSMMVNEEDHLRLQGIDSGLCLEDLLSSVDKLDSSLSKDIPFAFDPKRGYLTACPTNAGTGLRASCLVHLPGLALTGEINAILKKLPQIGMTVRGVYGEGTQVMGDFYQLSNNLSMGVSEKAIVAGITKTVKNIIRSETSARRALSTGDQKLRLQDITYRSLGAMMQSRLMSFEETMQHLSYLRMGLSLKWQLPADLKTVNELLVLTQPMHIQMLAGKELDPIDRDFLRATLLRKKFKQEAS